ncbi:RNA ligase/cyclic nucleotide phosphodiesterase [Mycena polygramma]|nr:RNA ligase/cyclic nucleotide phosphodiesterase [Mycena polygramma]
MKFDKEGNVQPFPGNTILGVLSPSSEPELYNSLLALHEKFKDSYLSHLYVLLPPSSWHMTVFEGVCDRVRNFAAWPDDLPNDASLEECNSLYEKKLSSFDLRCDPAPSRFTITGFYPPYGIIGLRLQPNTTEEETRLRGLRDRLSNLLRIRAGNHNAYSFHITIAYLLRAPSKDQEKELTTLLTDHFEAMPKQFELGTPEFCTFEDMFTFKRLFYLKNQ